MRLLRRLNYWRHTRRLDRAEMRRRREVLFAEARVARWESEQRRRLATVGLPPEIVNAPFTTPAHLRDDTPPTTELNLAAMIPPPRREDEQ